MSKKPSGFTASATTKKERENEKVYQTNNRGNKKHSFGEQIWMANNATFC
jgi:hypothetical protein